MGEQTEEDKQSQDIAILKNQYKSVWLAYTNLRDENKKTNKRLWNHLYFTRYILGSIGLIALFITVFLFGAYAFFKSIGGGDFAFSDELSKVHFYGIAIIGWVVMLWIIVLSWLYLFFWYDKRDVKRCE